MAIQLTLGNTPPALGSAQLGEQILRVTAQRLTFASVGYLYHRAARRAGTDASQIPR